MSGSGGTGGPGGWVPPDVALARATAEAEGRVALVDERIDAMLAGGIRAGDLCGVFGEINPGLIAARRVLSVVAVNCAMTSGPVMWLALNSAAEEARGHALAGLRGPAASVYAPPIRAQTVEDIEQTIGDYADHRGHDLRLVVIDPLEALAAATRDEYNERSEDNWDDDGTEGWTLDDVELRVAERLKVAARRFEVAMLVACVARGRRRGERADQRVLPPEGVHRNADVVLRVSGRGIATMVKNRHGPAQLDYV